MPIVEIFLGLLALLYLFIGWEIFAPMGWYFGEPFKRSWYNNVLYFIAFPTAVLMWLPILAIIVIGGVTFNRKP